MADNTEKKYKLIPKPQIDELTSMYDDYLFVARQHEYLLQTTSLTEIASDQIDSMYSGLPEYPWHVRDLNRYEKQKFSDFVNNDVFDDDKKTYIILRHINPEDDKGFYKEFAIPPYNTTSIGMLLPSMLERCSVIYPTNATLGNTEFYINGWYKATYTGTKNKSKSLQDFITDTDLLTELCIMLNLTETLEKNQYVTDKPGSDDILAKSVQDVYATERLAINENIILELFGSFAEKLLIICRNLYGDTDKQHYNVQGNKTILERAQADGLIVSANDLQDYVNIRHLVRHQFDTLDGLGHFSTSLSNKNKINRDAYVASYLKLFNKSIIQRMKSYIDILHQMQHVINTINPNRIIRYKEETNNKFIQRARIAHQQIPNIQIELNYPLASDKYEKLNKNLHKIIPEINIVDDYPDQTVRIKEIDKYCTRSFFLRSFHAIECAIMLQCKTRGRGDLQGFDAWKYLTDIGVLSQQEFLKWRKYALLRKLLSHNHFDERLRQQIDNQKDIYYNDLQKMTNKLQDIRPNVRKITNDIHEYTHEDGTVVRLDLKHQNVLYVGKQSVVDKQTPTTLSQQKNNPNQNEKYQNGIEINVSGRKILKVKLPIGITVNLDKHSIDWDNNTHWYTNKEHFHTLQTEKSKIIINRHLRVTEFSEQNRNIPFCASDNWLIDNRHHVSFDSNRKIQKFKFKTSKNNFITTEFLHTPEGYNVLIFSDGTIVLFAGQQMVIRHGGKILTFDNRKEFTDTYTAPQNVLQQILYKGKVH